MILVTSKLQLNLALPLSAAIAAMLSWAPWLLARAFVPAAVRLGLWAVSPRLQIHRLGLSELIHNLLFASLLAAALMLAR